MKYKIEGLDAAITIKKYEIKNGYIVLKMLKQNPKNAYYVTEHTEEAEEKTLDKMEKQSELRLETVDTAKLISEKRGASIGAIISIVTSIASGYTAHLISENIYKSILTSTTVATTALAAYYLSKRKRKNDEYKDYRKHSIYKNIKNPLKKIDDENLYNGVRSNEEILNINTLDNYSLRDLELIKDNIKRCREFGYISSNARTLKK